jgi:hypothetical protein
MADPAPVPESDGTVPVVPRALYYLLVDGTDAKDSVEYGRALESLGWHNLASEFLQPDPDDATRLIEPSRPYLPLPLFDASGKKKIAVVSPNGRNSLGRDKFWKRYGGEEPDEYPFGSHLWIPDPGFFTRTYGRHTAIEKSNRFMPSIMTQPSIETRTQDDGSVTAEFSSGLEDPYATGTLRTFSADLLLVSSHGWLGGFMRGNMVPAWSEAEPAEARGAWNPLQPFFVVGMAVEQGRGFHGPAWIILAQCSTVNEATWLLWAQVLANSQPFVRGILAYEEVSPGPEGSITIAENFFKAMVGKNGIPIVQAWAKANAKEKWGAIVHEQALDDRFDDWRSFKPLTSAETTATTGVYRGFLGSTKNSIQDGGVPIRILPPPFKFRMIVKLMAKEPEHAPPNNFPWGTELEITPARLADFYAAMSDSYSFNLILTPPDGGRIRSAKVTWVHIRPTYEVQPDAARLFQSIFLAATAPPTQVLTVSGRDILITVNDPAGAEQLELVVRPQSRAKLEAARLEAHHAYLWPSIDLTTDKGSLHYDFKTVGLSYYG